MPNIVFQTDSSSFNMLEFPTDLRLNRDNLNSRRERFNQV